jgi:pyruvate/2-oxoglutarate dehydrogenase complex dihydrolipoamide dehydrogenase (E3) component
MVLIIGAGPTGLAIAYYLQSHGIDYLILEKNEVGNTWKKQYESLHLNTHKAASYLPDFKFNNEFPNFPSAKEYGDYLKEFTTKKQIKVLEYCSVLTSIFIKSKKQWTISTNKGEFNSDFLITATGIWSYPFTPSIRGVENFSGKLIHSCNYHSPLDYLNSKVLIIGSGNSAIDIALALASNNVSVGISIRHGVNFLPKVRSGIIAKVAPQLYKIKILRAVSSFFYSLYWGKEYCKGLPRHPMAKRNVAYNPYIGFELISVVKNGKVKTFKEIKKIYGNAVVFIDDSLCTFDNIILATGYKPSLDFIPNEIPIDYSKAYYYSKDNNLLCVGLSYSSNPCWLNDLRTISKKLTYDIISKK